MEGQGLPGLLQGQGQGIPLFQQALHPLGGFRLLHGQGRRNGGNIFLLHPVVLQGHRPRRHPDADAAPVPHGVQELDDADLAGAGDMGGAASAHIAVFHGHDADVFRQVQLAPVVQSLQHLRVGILGGDGAVFRDDLVGQRFQLFQLFRRQLLVKIQDNFVFAQMKAHVGAAIQAVGQAGDNMLPGVALHPAEAQGPVQVPFHLCSRL